MSFGTNIRTWFDGKWHDGDIPVMRAADHGLWQGSSVFDGARYANGLVPDLALHCDRVNRSAEALMITPTMQAGEIEEITREGLRAYGPDQAVYIRPMYWAIDGGDLGVNPKPGSTGFAICLEQVAMPPADFQTTVTRTRFRRPVLEDNVCNAKAGCLYPNNARMLVEARQKGFGNALARPACVQHLARAGSSRRPVAQGNPLGTVCLAKCPGTLTPAQNTFVRPITPGGGVCEVTSWAHTSSGCQRTPRVPASHRCATPQPCRRPSAC